MSDTCDTSLEAVKGCNDPYAPAKQAALISVSLEMVKEIARAAECRDLADEMTWCVATIARLGVLSLMKQTDLVTPFVDRLSKLRVRSAAWDLKRVEFDGLIQNMLGPFVPAQCNA